MSRVKEIDGYRYVVVRLDEIAEINKLVLQMLGIARKLSFLWDSDDFWEVLEEEYEEYIKKLLRWQFGVRDVCFDLYEEDPEDCEAYLTFDNLQGFGYLPEVMIREDVYNKK